MAVSFFESMHGLLTDRWGKAHAIDFQLRAQASHTLHFVRRGEARLSGVVQAGNWADRAPVQGSLRIDPWRGRDIVYTLGFAGDDGSAYTLRGRKRLRWHKPVTSMTQMAVELHRDDEPIAAGEMHFVLADAVHFARSWRPVCSYRNHLSSKSLFASLQEQSLLSSGELDKLRLLGEAAILPNAEVPAVDEQALAQAVALLGQMPSPIVQLYRLALVGLDGLSVARHGRSFAKLSGKEREELLHKLAQGGLGSGAMGPRLALSLTTPIRLAHFNRPDYASRIGFTVAKKPRSEEYPRYMRQVVAVEQLEAEVEIEADVVVVGTGAGGAAVAATLAEKGLAVAVVEEGAFAQRREFSGDLLQRMLHHWRGAGMTFSVGTPPISIPLGRVVGGTTAINSGTCFRTPATVLDGWQRDLGFPSDFGAEELAPYYRQVEETLQVAVAEKRHLGVVADLVGRGADRLGLEHGPLPRNAPACEGEGSCIFGCPAGAKRSTNISYMPKALERGAALYTGLRVKQVLMHNRRAVGVLAEGVDAHGVSHRLRVRAGTVVLACGSIGTPALLMQSGFRLPHLGSNLSIHPALGMHATTDAPIAPWQAIPQGYAVRGYEDEGIMFEGFYLPPHLAGGTVPLMGEELSRFMAGHQRTVQFGLMVKDDSVGSVHLASDGQPWIRYDLSEASLQLLRRGAAILAEMLLLGGGSEIFTNLNRVPTVRTREQARQLATRELVANDFNLIGCHPLGTSRLATGPEAGVTDFEHRVFGTDNLYVIDGGSVPTSLGVNPQMTIMALALRAAEALESRLG